MDRDEFFRSARHDLAGPLDGVRVLDLGRVWSAPQACAVLGDLGADVVRVELEYGRDGDVPPAIPGTGLSWFRESVNRNKRSVGLDLRTPEGRGGLLDLVAGADVVVENFLPGTLDGWGVGYAGCSAVRPDIIFVSISGWGQYGRNARRAAYDPVIQATSGWMALNGEPDGAPVRAPTFLADEFAALHAVVGALAALAHRSRTNEGQHVDIAMLDAMLGSSSGLLALAAAGAAPQRLGNRTDFVVPSDVFRCTDGHVYVSVALNRHWRALAELIGRPELGRAAGFATNEERLANRAAVDAVVAAWCGERPAAAVEQLLHAAGLVGARVRTLREVAQDPDVVARGMLPRVELHNGAFAALTGPVAKFSRTPTNVHRAAPRAGADSAELLTARADVLHGEDRSEIALGVEDPDVGSVSGPSSSSALPATQL